MKFPHIDHIVLLGGARATAEIALALRDHAGYRCDVVTAPRQVDDPLCVDGETFGAFLDRHEIAYRVADDINEDLTFLEAIGPSTLAIGTGEAWSFTPATIERLEGRLVDLMGIPLPQYRGGAHYTWQILTGNRRGACNLQVVNEEMRPGLFDSGGIIKRRDYLFPAEARIPADYFDHASAQEADFVLEFLREVEAGAEFEDQALQEAFSVYFPRLNTRKNAFIDWQWSTLEIDRMICAFDLPYPGATTAVDGRLVRVRAARVDTSDGGFHPFQCGLVYRAQSGYLWVATRDGAVVVGDVRDEGGLDIIDTIGVGDRFLTPHSWMERGMSFVVRY